MQRGRVTRKLQRPRLAGNLTVDRVNLLAGRALLGGREVGPVEGTKRLEGHRLQPFVGLGNGLILLDQATDDPVPAIRARIVIDPVHGTANAPR